MGDDQLLAFESGEVSPGPQHSALLPWVFRVPVNQGWSRSQEMWGGETGGGRGREATGAGSGADALPEALSEQRGGGLSMPQTVDAAVGNRSFESASA